jgi:thermostable 8-oxoguanine DNA glycosylase
MNSSLLSGQKEKIDARLADFRRIWDTGSDRDLFAELAFCILTPQSRARICWPAIERLRGCDLLFAGCPEEILDELLNVRFRERKASYIVAARNQFTRDGCLKIKSVLGGFSDPRAARSGSSITSRALVTRRQATSSETSGSARSSPSSTGSSSRTCSFWG